ncbi:hypothetical protein AB1N83_000518 [Pleurotus pulmonarius]
MALRHNAKYFLDFVDFVDSQRGFIHTPFARPWAAHTGWGETDRPDWIGLCPRIRAASRGPVTLASDIQVQSFERAVVLGPQAREYLADRAPPTGRRYHVAQWVELGYTSFVQRTAPPTAAEAERLGWPVALKICHLREELAQAKAEANVEAQGGAHRPPDVAKRITDVFADELGRIHDACSWLRAREAEGIVGLATIVNARALPPKPVRAVKPGVPNARSTGPHPYSFKLSALPAQRDIPSVFEGPPAQAAFSFGCSSGEVAQLVGGLVTPPEPLKIANASAAQQDNLPPPETPMLPAILTPPVSILLSLANARLARSLPVAAVEPKPESPGQHANLEPLPQAPEPSHSPNDTAQASPEAPVSPTTPHRSPPFSPLSEKTRAEAEDVRRRMAAFRISV